MVPPSSATHTDDSSSRTGPFTRARFTADEMDTLRKLDKVFEVLLEVHSGMSLNQARTLLQIAIKGNGLQVDLVDTLKMKESTVSKNLQYWFGRIKHAEGQVPVAIDIRPTIENRRLNEIALSETGEDIVKSVLAKLK